MNEATANLIAKVRAAVAPVEPSAVTGENEPPPEILEAASADRAEDYGNPAEERTPGPIAQPSQPWIDNGAQLRYPAGVETEAIPSPRPGWTVVVNAGVTDDATVQLLGPGGPRTVRLSYAEDTPTLHLAADRPTLDNGVASAGAAGYPVPPVVTFTTTTQGPIYARLVASADPVTVALWVDYDPEPAVDRPRA